MSGPVQRVLSLLCLFVVQACNSSGNDGRSANPPDDKPSSAPEITWVSGSEGTQVFFGEGNELARCWNLETQYDCVYVNVFDIRSKMADAPVKRTLFRFLAEELPARRSDIEKLAKSDGYQCDVTESLGETVLRETLWEAGRIVEKKVEPIFATGEDWSPKYVVSRLNENRGNIRRPYFFCMAINDVIANGDITALDSALVDYASSVGVDRMIEQTSS